MLSDEINLHHTLKKIRVRMELSIDKISIQAIPLSITGGHLTRRIIGESLISNLYLIVHFWRSSSLQSRPKTMLLLCSLKNWSSIAISWHSSGSNDMWPGVKTVRLTAHFLFFRIRRKGPGGTKILQWR